MKIDLTYVFKSFDGKPIKIGDKDSPDMTMRDLCVKCLTVIDDRTKDIQPEEKYKRGFLAQRIYGAKESIDLPVEEVALLKELIGIFGSPLIVKQGWDLIDPSAEDPEPLKSS